MRLNLYTFIPYILILVLSVSCSKKKGCTDPYAINFDNSAEKDDGSCKYAEEIRGCTNPYAENFDPEANVDDGSCTSNGILISATDIPGCTNPNGTNFNPDATIDNGTCIDPRDKFVGNWTATHNCTTLPLASSTSIYNDSLLPPNVIVFDPLLIGGGTLQAIIDGNEITIPFQNLGGIFNYKGKGKINDKADEIVIEYEIGGFFPTFCKATYTKQ